MATKPHTEYTSASGTIVGFDFQYYYFLYKLLTLKKDETIGFEVLDDVHTQLNNDNQILIQVKHTIQKKIDGTAANLTELDMDLWKTINNWVCVITDSNDGRDSEKSQIEFVERTTFVLVSNKSFNERNKFLAKLTEFQKDNTNLQDITAYLTQLADSSDSKATQDYIKSVIRLFPTVLESFLRQIVFELDVSDIIQKCKTAIEEKELNQKDIEDLFCKLDSIVRHDIFKNFSEDKKVIYSFEEKRRKFRRYFDIARNPNLKIRKFTGGLPDSIDQQTFIKQLIDIEDIALEEVDLIEEYTRYRMMLESNLSKWVSEGELTSEEVNIFEEEMIRLWHTEFRSSYRGKSNPSEYIDIANSILGSMRRKELSISGQKLYSDMTHGGIYSLSNKPSIGWLKNWREKYK